MPENPRIDDKAFFAALDEFALVRRESAEGYTWEGVGEDRYAAETVATSLYAAYKLPPPRAFSWARSPRSMWGAITLLRQFQTETRYNVVNGLVPMSDPVETEAKRVMLDAVMDKTLTITLGGNLRDLFAGKNAQMRRSLVDLKQVLAVQMLPPKGTRMPSFADMTMWPIEMRLATPLQMQAIVIAPFMHVCFFSRPPKWIKTNEDGRLHCVDGPAVLFEDGYAVWAQQTPQEEQKTLPEAEYLALPAPEENE